jgi:hypothetical protein
MLARCEFCGKPASPTPIDSMLCANCVERYDAYSCCHCGERCHTLKSIPHAEACSRCELRGRMSTLSAAHREALGDLIKAGDRIAAIKAVRHALGIGIPEAAWVVDQFAG